MRLCVFCGSSSGTDPAYADAARTMGGLLAARDIGLVYGGARTGLMGIVADAVLAGGGEVDGVMPRLLIEKEVNHTGLTRLEIVETMHERKLRMAEISDGFIAMPGGIGTLEEIFEQWTWLLLGIHRKPCGFLNIAGYYDHLAAMLRHSVSQGFLGKGDIAAVAFDTDAVSLLDTLLAFEPPPPRWAGKA